MANTVSDWSEGNSFCFFKSQYSLCCCRDQREFLKFSGQSRNITVQAWAVEKVDNIINQTNHYRVDKCWNKLCYLIDSNLFHGWRYPTFQQPGPGRGGGGVVYSQENLVGVCGPLPKTLTLFMTKICDIPYPIYDLTKNLKPNLWPDPHIKISPVSDLHYN